MFYGCSSWDGSGVHLLDFSNTVHPNSMLEMFTDVPMTTANLGHLLGAIEATLPEGAVRYSVDVGCGPADALCSRRMDELGDRVEFIHSGPSEEWSYAFDDDMTDYIESSSDIYYQPTLVLDGIEGLDGHFVSSYNGCLVARQWGVFATHFCPPVGFHAVTRTGEELKIVERHRGPGDLTLVKFAEVAETEPVTLLDMDEVHPYLYRHGYCAFTIASGLPCFVLDRNETPRLFELFQVRRDMSEVVAGLSHNLAGGIHKRELTAGDSGSVGFLVNMHGRALVTHLVGIATGSGTSIGLCREWIESIIDEPLATDL